MRIIFILLNIFIYNINVLASGELSGFEFLRMDYSARTSAMSGALIAMGGDVNLIIHNPATMANTPDRQFSFNYNNYLLDLKSGFAAYSQRFDKLGQLSAIIAYMDYGEFEEADEEANKTGRNFGASDIAIAVSHANKMEEFLTYGVTIKYIHSSIDVWSADAIAFDFGIIYEVMYIEDLYLGLSLLNLGKALSAFRSTKENLPLNLRIGVAKKLEHLPLVVNFSINDLNVTEDSILDRIKKFAIGGEFTISNALRLRMGYNHELNRDLKTTTGAGFGGVGIGFGILYQAYRFDFSYNSYNELGAAYRFGISGTL